MRPVSGTVTSIAGVPFARSRWARALQVQRTVTGVEPTSIVSAVAIFGMRLPAFWSLAKKSRPGAAFVSEPRLARAAA